MQPFALFLADCCGECYSQHTSGEIRAQQGSISQYLVPFIVFNLVAILWLSVRVSYLKKKRRNRKPAELDSFGVRVCVSVCVRAPQASQPLGTCGCGSCGLNGNHQSWLVQLCY